MESEPDQNGERAVLDMQSTSGSIAQAAWLSRMELFGRLFLETLL